MKKLLVALSVCCSIAIADPALDSAEGSVKTDAKPTTTQQQPKVIMVKGSTAGTTNSPNTSKKTTHKTKKSHHSTKKKHKTKVKTSKKNSTKKSN